MRKNLSLSLSQQKLDYARVCAYIVTMLVGAPATTLYARSAQQLQQQRTAADFHTHSRHKDQCSLMPLLLLLLRIIHTTEDASARRGCNARPLPPLLLLL